MKTRTNSLRRQIDTLESRIVPAFTVSTFVSNGDLYIYAPPGDTAEDVRVEPIAGYYWVVQNGLAVAYKASSVSGGDVWFFGNGGNDRFQNLTGLRSQAYGMAGSDTLIGGSADDQLFGGLGQDYLYGMGGHDRIWAGEQSTADDSVNYVYGGAGNDNLTGGSYRDEMYGEQGTDFLYGWGGDDHLDGGTQNDYLYGMDGHDYLEAGLDNDWNWLEGGNGSDTMYGGNGYDYLYGQDGRDFLFGRAGNDELNGGDDGYADYLSGGAGYDWFQAEYFWFSNRDQPADFNGWEDHIYD
jgi:Ca2+-binding RTX toxin-like protein